MSDIKKNPTPRARRVKVLKRAIITFILVGIIVPWILCFILFCKINYLDKQIDSLSDTVENIYNILLEEESEQFTEVSGDIEKQNSINQMMYENEKSNPDSLVSYEDEESTNDDSLTGHKVYLTFDDGPSIYTEDILDILDNYGIKATFFVVGKEDEASQKSIKEIVSRGHSLGMHSYSHKYSELYASLDNFKNDFYLLQNYLFELTGVKSAIYRFPGGSSNTVSDVDMHDLIDFLNEENITFFDWNISSGDAGSVRLSVKELVNNSTSTVEQWNTSIILLHDSAEKSTTVEALPLIIEKIMEIEDTEFLPITKDTVPIQHIK